MNEVRIYAVADIHGRLNRLGTIRDAIMGLTPDLLVIAGDITGYADSAGILSSLNDLSLPVLAVRGNTDSRRMEKLCGSYPNIDSLHLKKIVMEGLPFVGVGGAIPIPFSSRFRFREGHVEKALSSMVERDTWLVVHPPPFGIRDEVLGRFHAGCRSLARIIRKCQPRICICGHIHERSGVASMGETLVVNCNMAGRHNGALIEYDGTGDITVAMLP